MSIIFADFPGGQVGLYGSSISNILNGLWAEIIDSDSGSSNTTLTNDPDPNIGSSGRVLRTLATFNGTQAVRFVLPTASTTGGFGCRLWMGSLPSTNTSTPFISFRNNANANLQILRILSTGAISFAGQTTSGPVVVANAYNHIEVKLFMSATVGTAEVRVNGVPVIAATGLNTGTDQIAQYTIGCDATILVTAASDSYWKDMVFWNASGSVGNDFQGSVAVRDLYTDADIDLNWTPSTGSTGWDLLDKTAVDDTTYIEAGDPPPDPAVFSLTDLPADVTSVRALLPIYRAIKTDGGDCNLQAGLTPNNTDWDDGADNPITTAYTFRWDVSELSPDTAAPWTPTEVNDAYVRINRTL